MVYLIGGPPRCGKSVLAQRLTTDRAISFVPTDLIWSVVEVGQPRWRSPMAKGPDRIPEAAAIFEPYLEQMIRFLAPLRQPWGIEGEVIMPETVVRLSPDYDLRVAFLVRSSATPAEISDSRGPNPWLEAATPDVISSVTAEVLFWSRHLQSACRRLGIPCFDVGGDFEHAIAGAVGALTAGVRMA